MRPPPDIPDAGLVHEFRSRPIGVHGPALQALLNHLRSPENSLQLLLIQAGADRWLLAERHPDRPPTPLDVAPFESREAAEWAAFCMRWQARYGCPVPTR